MFIIKEEYEELEIEWKDLQIGDIFEDNSKVLYIEPWEYRSCYELQSKDNKIIVSDEHLLKCQFYNKNIKINNKTKIVKTILKDNIITKKYEDLYNWSTAKEIYDNFNKYDIMLINENKNIKLFGIKLFKNGELQKVRCITTDTGEYQIGDFINHNTTSMAACINDFTKTDKCLDNNMIITLEDPIEYVYNSTKSTRLIQKELYKDFKTFPSGVRQALREHPNVIVIGEMRDKESIETGIDAARTGHSVIGSFHTSDVAESISRLGFYLADSSGNNAAMYDLIANLNLILCQRLTSSNNKFILETQYLMFTPEITKYLQNVISKGNNISMNIIELFKRKELINSHILSDWI